LNLEEDNAQKETHGDGALSFVLRMQETACGGSEPPCLRRPFGMADL
jgi:hypothetical protein